jgi:putative thioredoxin
MATQSPWILETSPETFQEDVIERSHELPVVIDFWAAWCQPCRLLGPMLEKLAAEHQGKFLLVKVDVDDPALQPLAGAFGVQSIPAVFAVRDGRIADHFVGVMPEAQIRAWLEGLLPSESETLADEAADLELADPLAAETRYREAIAANPNESGPRIGLARLLVSQDRLEEARQAVEDLAKLEVLDAAGEQVHGELSLQLLGKQVGDSRQAQAAFQAAPQDRSLQLRLAYALAAEGRYQEAMDQCLQLIQKDRSGTGEEARRMMVHIFHALGPEHPLADEYRRRLTMLLY